MSEPKNQIEVDPAALVRQMEEYGCGVACLAMVLGREYWQISRDFKTNFNIKSFKSRWYETYLYDHGCTVVKKHLRCSPAVASPEISGAMLKPFAPIHIVSICQAAEWDICHAVVMDAEGKLFDPSGHTSTEALQSIYAVPAVYGIWRPQDHAR